MIGGIFIGSGEARQYGDNLNLIVSLARQAGQALDRAYLFERERASVVGSASSRASPPRCRRQSPSRM